MRGGTQLIFILDRGCSDRKDGGLAVLMGKREQSGPHVWKRGVLRSRERLVPLQVKFSVVTVHK